EDQFTGGPLHGRGETEAAEVVGQAETPPLAVPKLLVALLESLRQLRREGLGIVGGRVTVTLLERVSQGAGGEVVEFGEHTAGGLLVGLGQHTATEPLLHTQHFEQVELKVSDIALVVAHGPLRLTRDPRLRIGY